MAAQLLVKGGLLDPARCRSELLRLLTKRTGGLQRMFPSIAFRTVIELTARLSWR